MQSKKLMVCVNNIDVVILNDSGKAEHDKPFTHCMSIAYTC